jgi:hypothetical protein
MFPAVEPMTVLDVPPVGPVLPPSPSVGIFTSPLQAVSAAAIANDESRG